MVNPTSNGATAPPLRHRESRLNWPLKLGRSKKETAPQFVVQLDGSDSNSSPFPQAGKDGSGKAQAPSHRVEGLGLSETPSINTAGPVVGGAFQGLASNNSSTLSLGMTPRAKQHSRHGSAETTKGHSENPSPSAEQQESDISSLGGLLTRQTFRSLLDNPIGLYKFGMFMASELNTENLVFYLNSQHLHQQLEATRISSLRIYESHLAGNAPMALNVSSASRKAALSAYEETSKALKDPFKDLRQIAFDSMYDDVYPRFIKKRLAARAKLEIQAQVEGNRSNGIGDAFVIADARKGLDLPVTLISDGFTRLTGFGQECIGKNCRFLSGPGTSRSAQERIRRQCAASQPCVELLLNYTASLTPFWCLLAIIPLYDVEGKVQLFVGAQINISSLLTSSRDMASLLVDELDPPGMSKDGFEGDVIGEQYASALATINDHISAKLDPGAMPRPLGVEKKKTKSKRLMDAVGRSISGSPKSPIFRSPTASPKPASIVSRPSTMESEDSDQVSELKNPTPAGGATLSAESRAAWEAHRRPKSSGGKVFGAAGSKVGLRGKLVDNSLPFSEQTKLLEQATNSFIVIDPNTYAVMYTCPTFRAEFGRTPHFLKAVKARASNGLEVAKQLREAIKEGRCLDVTVEEMIVHRDSPAQKTTIHLTPMKNESGAVALVIVALTSF